MCETHTKSVCMTYTFAETMRQRMEAKKLGLKDVADKLGWSFEHIRKLCSSEAFPSRPLREALADLLEIDRVEFEKQVNADRWRTKIGKPRDGHPNTASHQCGLGPSLRRINKPPYSAWPVA